MNIPGITNWEPMSLSDIAELIPQDLWILAGGYALEMFAGKQYREHGDIDIQVNREDQENVFSLIGEDRVFEAAEGMRTPIRADHFYNRPAYNFWVLNREKTAWSLQIMLYDTDEDGRFLFRRDETLSIPFPETYFEKEGIRILNPEVQILFKKTDLQGKDRTDFETIIPLLDKKALGWLENKMIKCYGSLWKFTG